MEKPQDENIPTHDYKTGLPTDYGKSLGMPPIVILKISDPEILKIKGDKGDQGDKGDKGDKGDIGPQGPRGLQGETVEKIIEQPIIKEVAVSDTPEKIVEKLVSLKPGHKLPISAIEKLKELLDTIFETKVGDSVSDTIRAGTARLKKLVQLWDVKITTPTNGQALVYDSTLKKWKNGTVSGSGGGLTKETPAGALDDSNVTFTVAHEPFFINVNGAIYNVGDGTYASYAGGNITLTFPVGTGGFIKSYY